ncbi:MAG: zinc ribbon domain-containing protein [Lachnospiraceae bacterium]|jgi:predicted house-cleaning noncanonical NTP pyrophosphatase (MazG superfamily)|nr:zinc ribbon domain-containing protein [Lachnospiraceae bacterium]
MDIFDKLGDTITTTGKEVANFAKDVAEMGKLNVQLKETELSRSKLYYKLGKKCYELLKDDPEEEIADVIEAIEKCDAEIARYEEEIAIAKGNRKCRNCGATYPQESSFCPNCGKENPNLK